MKRFLTLIGIAGILMLVLAATAFAARAPQQGTPQADGTPAPAGTPNSAQPSKSPEQGSAAWAGQSGRGMGMMGGGTKGGGMMGGRMMGSGTMSGGMMGGAAGTVQGHMGIAGDDMISMMAGVTPMHDDVEKMLDMTHQDLYNQMAAGKSLAQIAAEKGVTEQQLVDGIMAGRKAALDEAVAAGRMTRNQADAMLGYMQNNLKTMVNTPGMGLGTMWDTQPSQPGQSGRQNQSGQTGSAPNSAVTLPGQSLGPWWMHR